MCGVMREAVELARTVGKRLGDKDPIFKDLELLGRVDLIDNIFKAISIFFLTVY